MSIPTAKAARAMASLALVALLGVTGCSAAGSTAGATASKAPAQPTAAATTAGPTFDASGFKLTSPAFKDGGDIPEKYTCYGDNTSYQLDWVGAPANTAAFALIMVDTSAMYTHWVFYNLPGAVSGSLPEGAGRSSGAFATVVGWVSPCPPAGHRSTYEITFYALSAKLTSTQATTQGEVEDAIADITIASTTLTGIYALPD
jgi:Raf kinase inhibitor-like YbhB/YbcL family protein